MTIRASRLLVPVTLVVFGALAPASAQEAMRTMIGRLDAGIRAPNTGNTSPAENWRLDPRAAFNGVANAFNGTAALTFTTSLESGTFGCSGSLMPGGQYILTAAHCTDGLLAMTIEFGLHNGTALETRSAAGVVQHPGWVASGGALDNGSDLALVRLSAPVSNLNAYYISTTNDLGRDYIMTGYGASGTGYANSAPNWADGAYGHYGYNTFDVDSATLFGAWDAANPGAGTYVDPTYGVTYVSDFDAYNIADIDRYNTLQRIADLTGGSFSSGTGLGADEALIAGGDSGGGDFVWDAESGRWLLSAVHSWGWEFCSGRITPNCDYRTRNDSSYGDLSGATATYTHAEWIESVIGQSVTVPPVPEPQTYALMLVGLVAVAARVRRSGRSPA